MNASRLNSPFVKVLAVLIFIGAIATWAFWPRKLPPPDPQNRVTHMDGYSIIAPPGYTMSFETAEHTVTHNRGWMKIEPVNRGYYPTTLVVTVLADAPDWDTLKSKEHFDEGKFHGLPALAITRRDKHYWNYTLIFKGGDRWFNINLATAEYYDVPRSDWWPYIDSFKDEPNKATTRPMATTMPDFKMPTTVPADWMK